MRTTPPGLSGCTGERLLLLRLLRPQLKGLIDHELECRGHSCRGAARGRGAPQRPARTAKGSGSTD